MTEPDEKPTLFLPRTTAFFTGATLLAVVFLAVLVAVAVLLVEFHWLYAGAPAD